MPKIVIPRVCTNCGKEFVRRGRATQCEECSPPGSAPNGTRESKKPRGTSRDKDLAYAQEFVAGALFTVGMGLVNVDKHDAAVVLRASQTIPPQLAQALQHNTMAADAFVKIAQKGSIYYLGASVMLTVVAPILAHHKIGPKTFAMKDENVEQTINTATAFLNPTENPVATPESPDDGLDLSFLDKVTDAA